MAQVLTPRREVLKHRNILHFLSRQRPCKTSEWPLAAEKKQHWCFLAYRKAVQTVLALEPQHLYQQIDTNSRSKAHLESAFSISMVDRSI